jgi:hypothetical protein
MDLPANKDNLKKVMGILLMLIFLFVCLTIPKVIQLQWNYSFKTTFIISRILQWLCLFTMVLYAAGIEKTKFLLWKETERSFSFYLISILVLLLMLVAGGTIIGTVIIKVFHIQESSGKMQLMLSLFKTNKWILYVTVLTAGIVEELLLRGYFMPRLQQLFKTKFWSVFISSALFGLMHFSFGTVVQVIVPFYIGLLFALFYYKYRNIKTLIICHSVYDLIAILILIAHK